MYVVVDDVYKIIFFFSQKDDNYSLIQLHTKLYVKQHNLRDFSPLTLEKQG